MKLAVLALVLGLSGVAAADELGPVDPYEGPPPAAAPVAPAAAPPVMLRGQRPRQRGQLKQLLLAKFDRNHDGRLEPRERLRAAKVLHRLANRLANNQRRQQGRAQRRQKFIRKYDLNGDGNIGPGEMPPALGAEMRPLDRNGDGWLTGNELP
jgi:hypothetical protein